MFGDSLTFFFWNLASTLLSSRKCHLPLTRPELLGDVLQKKGSTFTSSLVPPIKVAKTKLTIPVGLVFWLKNTSVKDVLIKPAMMMPKSSPCGLVDG